MLTLFNTVLGFANLAFRAFVLEIFWGWFVIKVFPALPVLNLPQCLGLLLFYSAMQTSKNLSFTDLKDMKDQKDNIDTAITLGVGTLFHFMMH